MSRACWTRTHDSGPQQTPLDIATEIFQEHWALWTISEGYYTPQHKERIMHLKWNDCFGGTVMESARHYGRNVKKQLNRIDELYWYKRKPETEMK
jgi:hypothetical protein